MERIPEKTASTGSGIALYPSGIQPCSGKAGILTRKAAAKKRKIQSCDPVGRRRAFEPSWMRSKVMLSPGASTPVAIAAESISSEPTSV